MTAHINPVAVPELARYITEVTKRNEFLEERVQELLKANNEEMESRRYVQAVLREALDFLGDTGISITFPKFVDRATKAATTYRPKPEKNDAEDSGVLLSSA